MQKKSYCGTTFKAVFNTLIFFSETNNRWCLILSHYIPQYRTIIVCSSQLKTSSTDIKYCQIVKFRVVHTVAPPVILVKSCKYGCIPGEH